VASSSKNCRQVLEAVGLLDYFGARVDGEVSAEMGLRGKPDPDIFLTACKREDVNPAATCRKAPEIYILEKTPGGASVQIELVTDASLWTVGPSYAVWAEYSDGSRESIYVTCRAANDYWEAGTKQAEGLPLWYKVRSESGTAILLEIIMIFIST